MVAKFFLEVLLVQLSTGTELGRLTFQVSVVETTYPPNPNHPRKKEIEIKLNIQFSIIHGAEYLAPFLWLSLCLS